MLVEGLGIGTALSFGVRHRDNSHPPLLVAPNPRSNTIILIFVAIQGFRLTSFSPFFLKGLLK